MATITEKQAGIIKNCNFFFQKYSEMECSDDELWESWWRSVSAMDKKYINEDPSIYEFMKYRMKITFRDLQVVRGGIPWPIKK